MKQKIRLHFFIIGGISIVLTSIFSTLVFYGLFQKQIQEDLKTTAQLLGDSDSSGENLWELYDRADEIRVTLISPDGAVLLETDADTSAMQNHKDRPEVAAALEIGQGQAVRRSATLSEDTFYYAVRLSDGNILRLARNAHSVWVLFAGVLPSIALVVIFIFGLSFMVSGLLTQRIVAPIESMAEQMEQAQESPPYDELAPFARALKQKNDNIRKQMERLNLQKQQIQLITSNMNEGLILLGADKRILSVNASAVRMVGESGEGFTGKSLFYLSRNEQLGECVARAAQGTSKTLETLLNNMYIQIFASPVYHEDEFAGVICFLLDITEKKRHEKMRREFTANVSHELKTPLTSVCGYAELLADGVVRKADVREFGGKIHRESMRLLDLITDIIKLSELDDAPKNPELADCGLLELARDCAATLVPLAQKGSVTLTVEGEECVISANRAMIEQLIRNLLDNAIRYNKPGGSVAVSVVRRPGEAVLCVKDTGIGIAKEYQSRIFERFYRVDKSRSKATGGTGLGLAIVKHIAEYHGATIDLQSAEGEGTTITITFAG